MKFPDNLLSIEVTLIEITAALSSRRGVDIGLIGATLLLGIRKLI